MRHLSEISSLIQEANKKVEADVHSAYTIKTGMAKSIVLDRLATSSMTSQEMLAEYKTVIWTGNQPPPNKEYWLYKDIPPGHSTDVVINDGVVESTVIEPTAPPRTRSIALEGQPQAPHDGRAGSSAQITARLGHLVKQTIQRREYKVITYTLSRPDHGVAEQWLRCTICGAEFVTTIPSLEALPALRRRHRKIGAAIMLVLTPIHERGPSEVFM